MAYNYDIEKDKPPDTGESPSLGAQRIRYFKEAVIERLKNWIYGFLSDSETDEGLKKAPLKAQDPAPSQEAGKMIVYAKDVSGIAELFARDKNGVEIQLTSGGKAMPKDHGVLEGLTDDDHTAYYNSARHTKAVHDALAIDHGSLTGLGDDDHSQYLNNTRHDVTARHPQAVLKFDAGSFSGSVEGGLFSSIFEVDTYSHAISTKTSSSSGIVKLYHASNAGAAYHRYYQLQNLYSQTITLYAFWYYHSNSEQAIWGIWDKEAKKLIAILVEEDEGYCKLHPELKEGQMLVKFKNPEKFLDNGDKAEIKEKTMAGYVLEIAKVTWEDLEEIK